MLILRQARRGRPREQPRRTPWAYARASNDLTTLASFDARERAPARGLLWFSALAGRYVIVDALVERQLGLEIGIFAVAVGEVLVGQHVHEELDEVPVELST